MKKEIKRKLDEEDIKFLKGWANSFKYFMDNPDEFFKYDSFNEAMNATSEDIKKRKKEV